jgi:cell division protein ZapA
MTVPGWIAAFGWFARLAVAQKRLTPGKRGELHYISQPKAGARNDMKIEIYDQMYNVNSDGQSEEHLRELASYVDGKMREVAEATRMVDSVKVAVLAALNIADEMFAQRARQEAVEGPLRKRVEKCVALVEKALEASN